MTGWSQSASLSPRGRRWLRGLACTLAGAYCLAATASATEPDATRTTADDGVSGVVEIAAQDCFLRVRDEADIPAQDAGVLALVPVRQGTIVKLGDVMATLNADDATLQLQLAESDLRIAELRLKNSLKVAIATSMVAEAKSLVEHATLEKAAADHAANTEVAIQLADAAAVLADEELRRAQLAKERFGSSVGDLELLKLASVAEQKKLEVQHARHQHALALLEAGVHAATIGKQSEAARRLTLELQNATNERSAEQLEVERLGIMVRLAHEKLRRREIHSPLAGIVTLQLHQPGEWVEPGESVFHVLRLDVLAVEGFVREEELPTMDTGCLVRVTPAGPDGRVVEGVLTFISPEVDSVNHVVQVRAEIDNADLKLRPGQPVSMTILRGTPAPLARTP